MFSTVDALGNRFLRCTLITDQGDLGAEVPSSLRHLVEKVTSIPTPELLADFAQQVARVTWTPSNHSINSEASDGAAYSQPEHKMIALEDYDPQSSRGLQPGNMAVVVGVRVEVWRLVFDSQKQRVSAEKILAATASQAMN